MYEAIVLNEIPSALPDSGYDSPNGFTTIEKMLLFICDIDVIDALNSFD